MESPDTSSARIPAIQQQPRKDVCSYAPTKTKEKHPRAPRVLSIKATALLSLLNLMCLTAVQATSNNSPATRQVQLAKEDQLQAVKTSPHIMPHPWVLTRNGMLIQHKEMHSQNLNEMKVHPSGKQNNPYRQYVHKRNQGYANRSANTKGRVISTHSAALTGATIGTVLETAAHLYMMLIDNNLDHTDMMCFHMHVTKNPETQCCLDLCTYTPNALTEANRDLCTVLDEHP
jgi:hypothetical protein